MIYTFQIVAALLLDFLFGDPHWYPHPVRLIGVICRVSENTTRKYINNQFTAGFLTVIIVLFVTGITVFFLLTVCYGFSVLIGDIAAVILLYTSFAARDLIHHSGDVFHRLTDNRNLDEARKAVGKIVGRDTHSLNDSEISKACVETVAENMVDGITAPFFFALLFGLFSPYVSMTAIGFSAVGALLYKAVNTMDSMIGYKNDKYVDFGRIAARLDDFVNLLPSRISGLMVILAAFILKLDYRRAFKIFIRDRLSHSSPNAGHTEAAVAGALGIRLGGPSSYFGKAVSKRFIGDDIFKITPDNIKTSNKLVLLASLLFIAAFLALYGVISNFN